MASDSTERGTVVWSPRRDPRAEKHRDYRNAGHCRRANCGICHPEKKWRAYRKARRALGLGTDGFDA